VKPILPGQTIGILGGGQLGRMMAMAARSLGYGVHAFDPDPACAAKGVVDQCLTASFSDELAAAWFARGVSVVTLEIEKVSLPVLEAAAKYAPVRPGASVLGMVQDRGRQKSWLAQNGLPLGPWRLATSDAELRESVRVLGGRCFVKSCHGGYDGRGQVEVRSAQEAEGAWVALGEKPCVVEAELTLQTELSVMVARRPSGEVVVFPPALNHHEERILAWSVIPGPLPGHVVEKAMDLARTIAGGMHLEGLLAIEMFLLPDGELLVNELAPRPHNSFHATERACHTSQFEQAVRAVCDLPLGSTEVVTPTAIANLLGDLWLGERPPDFDAALRIPGVRLHLYGKSDARPGRKMGHLSAVGSTPDEAVRKARLALRALTPS
jgi:5-(carboxyamino)imidazole ribonucleotide synthase